MKFKHFVPLLFLFFLASSYLTLTNSDELVQKIYEKLNKYSQNAPQEKVYVHFDKPYYIAGETMWFKGYLFDAQSHGIDSVSRVLYVDLLNPSTKSIVQHLTLKCTSGTANGEIKLPETLTEGVYQVRAYTNFMRNYSEDFYFNKEVKIGQTKTAATTNEQLLKELNTVADCQFFPEGGNLVGNVLSRVGFKAVNKYGRGVDVQGVVLDNDKDTVCYFKSERLGMGMLSFKPQFGRRYTAKVKKIDGTSVDFTLPQVSEKGYVLLLDNISNRTNIKVYVNNNNPQPADKAKELVIIGQQRGKPYFSAKIPNTKEVVPLNIPRQSIPDDGVLQITLFDSDGTPLCERIVFIKKQEQQINLKLTADKTSYKPREKVTLTLEATDSLGKPVQGNFSIAATDAGQVPPQYENNILSYLLLTSDLKGHIEDPAYYFTPKDFNATRHLDYLMMTQGWRRFTWKDVMTDKLPRLDFAIEQGLSIAGKAMKYNKKGSSNAKITLFIKANDNKNPIIAVGECDSSGHFAFYNLNFSDTCQILVQAVKEKGGRGLDIALDSLGLPKVLSFTVPTTMYNADPKAFAEFVKRTTETLEYERQARLREEKMLNTLEVKAKKKEKVDGRRIYGKAYKSIVMTEDLCTLYRTVFDVVQAQVAGLRVNQDGFDYTVSSRGGTLNFAIDGFITDNTYVSAIQPCDVEAIDVLRGADAAMFGINGGDGVINVLMKTGAGASASQTVSGIITGKKIGYTIAKEFYAPQYDVSKPEHDLPDYRSTLHWQPIIKTDASGKATITYWNSDAKSKIYVQAEGFSKMGRVAVAKMEYLVN